MPFEIPDSWVWTRFSQIVSFDLGKTPDRHNNRYWNNGKYPWFTIADLQEMGAVSSSKEKISEIALNEKFAGKLIPRGTLLMSFKLTVGKTSILYVDAVHNEAIISIFPIISEHEITRDFLLNVLPVLVLCVKKRDAVKGATLNSSKLATMFVPLPPLSEQQRIVSRVGELFEQIDIIEKNQADIDALYDEFRKRTLTLAIQGKLVPQDPNDEPASVLLEHIRAEKKAKLGKKFVDSYIYKGDDNCYYEHIAGRAQDELVEVPFDIPDNWVWVRVNNCCDIRNGFTPSRTESKFWDNGTIPWFTVEDINSQGKIIKTTKQYITELATTKERIVPANSLLLCCTASVGIFAKNTIALTTNQQFNGLTIKSDYTNMLSINYLFAIGEYFSERLHRLAGKTTFEFVSVKKLGQIILPIPPLAEQNRIVAKTNEIFAML